MLTMRWLRSQQEEKQLDCSFMASIENKITISRDVAVAHKLRLIEADAE